MRASMKKAEVLFHQHAGGTMFSLQGKPFALPSSIWFDHKLTSHCLRNSIRLLKIRFKNAEDQLEVSLSLSTSAWSFNALSYTWDNPLHEEHPYYTSYDNEKCSVSCEGSSIRVTENLIDALRQLSRDVQLSDASVWIDATCINQRDVSEKNAINQVDGRDLLQGI
ncbi:hypothetical protein BU25DRAFT_413222 [Macroventuria anomochaeta]|uniref:Uncharacterized protein n=1 Tax=Macroventuria anomochaeta TaxID=301207 RepID=A0ACB6RU61_9PLEO|nr:uncharacterized protein BU25DRAFT_413222 [Macroventuria anomochaeta]KAF2624674.1 hypothetical protein BU25DRAFT_413222 [Macroventuria anomochaeta]